MNMPAGINKWGIAVLAVVCLLLVVFLVGQYRAMQPGKSFARPDQASRNPARTEKVPSHLTDDLAQYDPTVHFDKLKSFDSRPLPDDDRDPFGSLVVAGSVAAQPVAPAPSAPPPPPPPPPAPTLAAVGYNELPGGTKEAMVTFKEGERKDEIVTVHEGDVISGTKLKITKITSAMVVVEDGDQNKTFELPFPP